MSKILFDPTRANELIVNRLIALTDDTKTRSVNDLITDSILPQNKELRHAATLIIDIIQRNGVDSVSNSDIRQSLYSTLVFLKKHPINESRVFKSMILNFFVQHPRCVDFDFILKHTSFYEQNKFQSQKNFIYCFDKEFNLGTLSIEDLLSSIFQNWDKLYSYEKTYEILAEYILSADMIENSNPIDALFILKDFDIALSNSFEAPSDDYDENYEPSVKERISALDYQISVYLCDNGYAYFSNDRAYKNVPKEYYDYTKEFLNLTYKYQTRLSHLSAEEEQLYLSSLQRINDRGQQLMRFLYYNNHVDEDL